VRPIIICEVCRTMRTWSLLVVTSREITINPIINQTPSMVTLRSWQYHSTYPVYDDEMKGVQLRMNYSALTSWMNKSYVVRRWAGHVARMGEKRNAYNIMVGKPEGKRPLGRPRRR
jgi:hypothetical protein